MGEDLDKTRLAIQRLEDDGYQFIDGKWYSEEELEDESECNSFVTIVYSEFGEYVIPQRLLEPGVSDEDFKSWVAEQDAYFIKHGELSLEALGF